MKRVARVLAFLCVVFILQTKPAYSEGTTDKSVRKLGRGLTNVATGWLELPMQISSGMSESGSVQGFFIGLGKGAVFTVLREAAGVYDTATFLFPIPSDYAPLMQPPTVFKE